MMRLAVLTPLSITLLSTLTWSALVNSPATLASVRQSTPSSKTNQNLPQGFTLMGGNPVAPAPVAELPKHEYHTAVSVSVIHPEYASPAPKVGYLPKTVKLSIPPSLGNRLAAYYFPLWQGSLYIVGLKGMTSTAEVGQDGSYNVTLRGHGIEVYMSSTGACQGCAVDAAAMYFPSARVSAQDYGGYHGPYVEDLPVQLTKWNSTIDLWGYKERGGTRLAGIAYYRPVSKKTLGVFFQQVVVGKDVQTFAPWVFQNTVIQQGIKF